MSWGQDFPEHWEMSGNGCYFQRILAKSGLADTSDTTGLGLIRRSIPADFTAGEKKSEVKIGG